MKFYTKPEITIVEVKLNYQINTGSLIKGVDDTSDLDPTENGERTTDEVLSKDRGYDMSYDW